MIQILQYLKDPKLWEFGCNPYCWSCRIYIINIWVVVKIIVPFWVPTILRHL